MTWFCLKITDDFADKNDDESKPFYTSDQINIFTSALYCVARAVKLWESDAENWFKDVDVKFEICKLRNATIYQALFVSSDDWGINSCLSLHDCQIMYEQKSFDAITNINLG